MKGRSTSFFQSQRGLRQECPLSLVLYILMAKSLSRALEQERIPKKLSRISIVQRVKAINYSQFANDTHLLGGTSNTISKSFKVVLESYLKEPDALVKKVESPIFCWNSPILQCRQLPEP